MVHDVSFWPQLAGHSVLEEKKIARSKDTKKCFVGLSKNTFWYRKHFQFFFRTNSKVQIPLTSVLYATLYSQSLGQSRSLLCGQNPLRTDQQIHGWHNSDQGHSLTAWGDCHLFHVILFQPIHPNDRNHHLFHSLQSTLPSIAKEYENLYGRTLAEDIEKHCKDDYRHLLLSLVNPKY